jgi:hypothetical protein
VGIENCNNGCHGGSTYYALDYVKSNGLMLEREYPYTAVDGICQFDATKVAATISGYASVAGNDPEQLKASIANRPTAITIDYHNLGTRYYKAGVITSETCLN